MAENHPRMARERKTIVAMVELYCRRTAWHVWRPMRRLSRTGNLCAGATIPLPLPGRQDHLCQVPHALLQARTCANGCAW